MPVHRPILIDPLRGTLLGVAVPLAGRDSRASVGGVGFTPGHGDGRGFSRLQFSSRGTFLDVRARHNLGCARTAVPQHASSDWIT